MSGETDLATLIASMQPVLAPDPYVYCTFPGKGLADLAGHDPVALICEAEGVTAILPAGRARDLGLPDVDIFRRITLTVHSSLEAVGLTAAISTALARKNIPANVVAGYFHDHVFVPQDKADEALAVLNALRVQE